MRKTFLISVVCQMIVLSTLGQEKAHAAKKIQYVKVPQEEILVVIVNQPDSPLAIEAAECLFSLDKRKTIIRYKVRNLSSKSIATFGVVSWDANGAGGTLPVPLWGDAPSMAPGGVLESINGEEDYQILPLTTELRNRLKQDTKGLFAGKMLQVYFLLIDHVYFVDGSVYKAERVSNRLQSYLSDRSCGVDP